MKLLSVAIPSYNSEGYLENCVSSLLTDSGNVEIIIVNDGSTDGTLQLAQKLQEKNPDIIKIVDKKNGGHGSAVMAGIKNATGKYFKVVDSDDWVDSEAYPKLLSVLQKLETEQTEVDMLLSNFIYDKQGALHKKVMHYRQIFPQDKIFSWKDSGHFPIGTYILMHSIIYRTEILRECQLELPEHTFYVDNIFAFSPLPYVKKIYYANINFYHYFIGRNDQSVNQSVMIKRIDQQLRVNKIMIDEFKKDEKLLSTNLRLKKYMFDYLEIITGVSSIMLYLSGTPENLEKKIALWQYIKETDSQTYKKLRMRLVGMAFNIHGAFGRHFCILFYKLLRKFYGFN